MTVMFPIVLFIAAWVCDILFWAMGELFWATLGLVSLCAGLIAAVVAAVFGMIDYFGDARIRAIPAPTRHFAANVTVVGIEIANFFWRMNGGPDYVVPTGVVLSTLAVALLGYSGWKGASLVYRHGVGVDSRAAPRQGG
jgi:uncharacterized membrane protein